MSIRKILNTLWFLMTLQTTFIICSSGHKQKHGVEASRAKIQQIYENLDFDLDLKLLFMVTEAYYESDLLSLARFLLHLNTPFFSHFAHCYFFGTKILS